MERSQNNIEAYCSFSVSQAYGSISNYNWPPLPSRGFFIIFQTEDRLIGGSCSIRRADIKFIAELRDILGKNSTTCVSNMLYQVGIVSCHHQFLTGEIKATTRHMTHGAHNAFRFQIIVKMVRIIGVDIFIDELLSSVGSYKQPEKARLLAKKLEKMRVGELGSDKDRACAICLEDVSISLEAIRLPCSHTYHTNCIFRWLVKSNMCPMCRCKH